MRRKIKLFSNSAGFCFWPFAIFYEFFRVFIMKEGPDDEKLATCCCNCCCDACCHDTCGRRRSCIRCG
jgi:hypothetical protein